MEFRFFALPRRSPKEGIAILRMDPTLIHFELAAALRHGQSLTAEAWADAYGFAAVINAGMFRLDDRRLGTGYLRDANGIVSSFLHPNYRAFFLFSPRRPGLPPVRFVDRDTEPQWQTIMEDYHGVIQNYLLFGPSRTSVWPSTDRRHSQAALGVDETGRVVWIHCRPSLTTPEFVQTILDLPLHLTGAMYLEGGADAALFFRTPHGPMRFVGEYSTGPVLTSNEHFWPVPNVLGARILEQP